MKLFTDGAGLKGHLGEDVFQDYIQTPGSGKEMVYDPARIIGQQGKGYPGSSVPDWCVSAFPFNVEEGSGLSAPTYTPYSIEAFYRYFYRTGVLDETVFHGGELVGEDFVRGILSLIPFYKDTDMLSTAMDALREERKKKEIYLCHRSYTGTSVGLAELSVVIAYAHFVTEEYRKLDEGVKDSLFEVKKGQDGVAELWAKEYNVPLLRSAVSTELYREDVLLAFMRWMFLLMYTRCVYNVTMCGADGVFERRLEQIQDYFKEKGR